MRCLQDSTHAVPLRQMPADYEVGTEQEIKKAIEEYDCDLYEINEKVKLILVILSNNIDVTFSQFIDSRQSRIGLYRVPGP